MERSSATDVAISMQPRSTAPFVGPFLSFVAGYVDSCTFLSLFGLFVAQVTGSFVFAGAQLVAQGSVAAIQAMGIAVFFVAGVMTTIAVKSAREHVRFAVQAALAVEAMLLAGLLATWLVGRPLQGPNTTAVLCASLLGLSAMGVQSALVRLLLRDSPSTNVMTTNTTQLAVDTTVILLAWRSRREGAADAETTAQHADARRRAAKLWLVMMGFFLGTVSGAAAYLWLDLWCITIPIAVIGALSARPQAFLNETVPGA